MSLYKQPGSDVWHVRFKFQGELIRRSTGHYDRQKAQRFEDELKAELWKRPAALKGKTWGKAVIAWAEEKSRSDSDLLCLAKLGEVFPDRLLSEVTPAAIDKALASFCKTPATYVRYRTRIAAILKMAEVPVKLINRQVENKTRDWLTHEQWETLRKELPPHMLAMATFAITTGLRQANVLGLQWDRVDLARKLVWVEASSMKSNKAIGVPLSIEAVNVLKTVQGQHPEFCFTYRGKPVKEIKTAFHAACCRAGVGSYSNSGQYVGFAWHGLRHTWATWHIQNGTPLDVLQKLGGWADMRMVLNYAHHSAGHLAQYADNTEKK